MSEPNVSFAQNGEDIVLWRALNGIENGVYIDVGANHPTDMSVTRKFYDQGWSGIAIEPSPTYAEEFRTARPRDVVFEAVASDGDETSVPFHLIEGTGLSTLVDDISASHASAGFVVTDIAVPVISLTHAIEQSGFAEREIHFLSIDTEGAEAQVLASMDFTRFRPWILVIEATAPLSTEQVHLNWQKLVDDAGYTFCLFDGLSRFYVANEHAAEFAEVLSYPAGILDDFISIAHLTLLRAYNAKVGELEGAQLRERELCDAFEREQAVSEGLRERLAAVEQQLAEERAAVAEKDAHIDALQHTVSWRLTKPLRSIRGRAGA